MSTADLIPRIEVAQQAEYRGRFDEARSLLRGVLADAPAGSDADLLQDVRFRLGKLLIAGGHRLYPEAETLLLEAHGIAVERKRPRQVAVAMNYRGLLARQQGDIAGAEALLKKNDILAKSSPPGLELGQWLHYRGLVAQARHDAAFAERMYLRAVQAYRELHFRQGVAEVCDSYANLMLSRGKTGWATVFAERSLEARDDRDLYGRAIGLGTMGRIALLRTRYDEARDCFGKDLELARQLGDDRGIGQMLNSLGEVELQTRRFDEAELHYLENLKTDRGPANEAHACWGLARVLLARNRQTEAADIVERMEAVLKDRPGLVGLCEVSAGLRGAIAWRTGAIDEGESGLKRAIAWLTANDCSADAVPLLYELRDLYWKSGRLDDAVRQMGEAIAILDRVGAERGVHDVEVWLRKAHAPGLVRLALAQHIPECLVDGIVSGTLARPDSKTQEVTLLFCDLRGFTAWSERTPADVVVSTLNEWFGDATQIVQAHGGMVDKFIGDCVMALFGVTPGRENPAADAVRAAQEMWKTIYTMNIRRRMENQEPLHIGIGLHTGPAVVGLLGSNRRQSFTAIGDTVNTASRIESATKDFPECPILMSEATKTAVNDADVGEITLAGMAELKGKSFKMPLYYVRGGQEESE